jgi:CBS domain-containing protein
MSDPKMTDGPEMQREKPRAPANESQTRRPDDRGAPGPTPVRGGADAGETPRQAGEAGGEAMRRSAEAGGEAPRRAAEAMTRSAEAGGDALRRPGAGSAEAPRRGAALASGSAAQMAGSLRGGAERTGEGLAQTAGAIAHAQTSLAGEAAEQFSGASHRFLDLGQAMAERMHGLMPLAQWPAGTLPELQQTMARMMTRMLEAQSRAAQEMMHRAGPMAVAELQQQLLREVFDTLSEGGKAMLNATRRHAAPVLEPAATDRAGMVGAAMHRGTRVASPEDTVQQAAKLMTEVGLGALAVGEHDKLVGMLTERDLAQRLVAEGRDPARTIVRDVMTPGSRRVFEDESLADATAMMGRDRVKALPVLNREMRLVGMLTAG